MKEKTKEQLINELIELRQRTAELEKSETIRENEEKYRSLIESSDDPIYLIDRDFRYIYANKKLLSRFGKTESQVFGHAYKEFHSAEGVRLFSEKINKVFKSGKPYIYEYKSRRDGRDFLRTFSPVIDPETGEVTAITVVSKDVTEQKKTEKQLRESEIRYRSVFENTGAATVIFEEDATISMVNAECEKLSGYSKKEVEGKQRWTENIVPEDLEMMKRYHVERRKNGGKAPTEYEFRFIDRQGNIKDIHLQVGMIPGTKRSIASLLDITARKQAEAELWKSEEKFRILAETTPIAVLMYQDDKWVYANSVACEISGYSKEELLSMNYWDSVHPDYQELIKEREKQRQAGTLDIKRYDFKIITKNGKEKWVDLSGGAVAEYKGKPAGIIKVDPFVKTVFPKKQVTHWGGFYVHAPLSLG